ncbi:transporter substrate-binding domain-containing protein [Actinomadura barringtoniae]|uniref:Transporter substrate-binding domain-containing protein n=2 Tax=Actinomadura barringtoniae TaxID=1427535 RepID=A0A939T6F5_9ACTN|nr:transporter substrate-binding domain-containing protein [Actinomadura barringtoniae]
MRRLLVLVSMAVLVTACGGAGSGDSLLDKKTLVVGVRPDLPGLGLKTKDGQFVGFDVDVARYIADRLGKKVTFTQVLAADRIPSLLEHKTDMVLATLSVTPDRKTQISYAGPYYLSYQDILVRSEDSAVRTIRDLKGRSFCTVKGSDATARLAAVDGMSARLVPAADYNECMTKIRTRRVDAITTNDVILAGLIKRAGGGLRLVNAKFAEQRTGIGIRKGDPDACEALNKAITQMYYDGTAARLVHKWFDGTGLDESIIEVPQLEGCDD